MVQAFPSHSAAGSIDLQHHRRRQSGGTAQHSTAQHGTGTTARATDTRIRADSTALDSRVCVHYVPWGFSGQRLVLLCAVLSWRVYFAAERTLIGGVAAENHECF